MTQRQSLLPLLLAHASLAVGQMCYLSAFTSGDPSGIQYIMVFIGMWPIGVAALVLLYLAVFSHRPPVVLSVCVLASFATAILSDRLGAGAVVALLVTLLAALGRSVRYWRRPAA